MAPAGSPGSGGAAGQEFDRIVSGIDYSNELNGDGSRTGSASSSINVDTSPKRARKKYEKHDPRKLMSDTEIAIMERKKAKKERVSREKIEVEVAEREQKKREAEGEKEAMMLKAGPSQKLKMSIAQMQKALWTLELTAQQRSDLNEKIASCRNKMSSLEAEKLKDREVAEHYAFLSSDPDLVKVVRLFWICLLSYVHDGELNEEGYIELSIAGQYALMDNLDDEAATIYAKESYDKDLIKYGKLDQTAMYDILFETVTSWLDIFDAVAYTTFIWSYLHSIFDFTEYPPKIKSKRYMKCVTREMSEATMLHTWFKDKKRILDILVLASEMSSHPQKMDTDFAKVLFKVDIDPHKLALTQRTQSRKQGRVMSEDDEKMLAFMAAVTKQQDYDVVTDSDSDSNDVRDVRDVRDGRDNNNAGVIGDGYHQDGLGADMNDDFDGVGGLGMDDEPVKFYVPRRAQRASVDLMEARSGAIGMNKYKKPGKPSNYIGALRGNIFYGRKASPVPRVRRPGLGQAPNAGLDSESQWSNFVANQKSKFASLEGSYAELALHKMKWLNEVSGRNAEIYANKGLYGSMNLKLDGWDDELSTDADSAAHVHIAGRNQSLTGSRGSPRSQDSFTPHRSRSPSPEAYNHDELNLGVLEVMQLIRDLSPGAVAPAIPAYVNETKITDVVLKGHKKGISLLVEEPSLKRPESSHTYAPTYQYHQKKHVIMREKYKKGGRLYSSVSNTPSNKAKPPLKRLLDKSNSLSSLSHISAAQSWASWSDKEGSDGSGSIASMHSIQQSVLNSTQKRDFQGVVMNARPMGPLGTVPALGSVVYNDDTSSGVEGAYRGDRLGWTPIKGVHTLSPASRHALSYSGASDGDGGNGDDIDKLHSVTKNVYETHVQQERGEAMLAEALNRMIRIQEKSTTKALTTHLHGRLMSGTTENNDDISVGSFQDTLDSREGCVPGSYGGIGRGRGGSGGGNSSTAGTTARDTTSREGGEGGLMSPLVAVPYASPHVPPSQDSSIFINTESNEDHYDEGNHRERDDGTSTNGGNDDQTIATMMSNDGSEGMASSILRGGFSDSIDRHLERVQNNDGDDDIGNNDGGSNGSSDGHGRKTSDGDLTISLTSLPLEEVDGLEHSFSETLDFSADSTDHGHESNGTGTNNGTHNGHSDSNGRGAREDSLDRSDDLSQQLSLFSVSNVSQLSTERSSSQYGPWSASNDNNNYSYGYNSTTSNMGNNSISSQARTRVETLAAEILNQRSSMITAQVHKKGAQPGIKGPPPEGSTGGSRGGMAYSSIHRSRGEDDDRSVLSSSTLDTLGSQGSLSGHIRPVKNQTLEDAFIESLYIRPHGTPGAGGPRGAGDVGRRWKLGGKSLKHEYVPSITCKVYDRDR